MNVCSLVAVTIISFAVVLSASLLSPVYTMQPVVKPVVKLV